MKTQWHLPSDTKILIRNQRGRTCTIQTGCGATFFFKIFWKQITFTRNKITDVICEAETANKFTNFPHLSSHTTPDYNNQDKTSNNTKLLFLSNITSE
jgi:hypothetical protein